MIVIKAKGHRDVGAVRRLARDLSASEVEVVADADERKRRRLPPEPSVPATTSPRVGDALMDMAPIAQAPVGSYDPE